MQERITKAFGNREKAEAWLDLPREPDSRTPRQMFTNTEGKASVWDALVQIDEGIFS